MLGYEFMAGRLKNFLQQFSAKFERSDHKKALLNHVNVAGQI